MAAKKTELMAQFYEQCQKKGYTDMHDEVQSLKAKVIAVDLGLDYKEIVSFYDKAKECYKVVQLEAAEVEEKRRILAQQEKVEAARRAVNGQLLLTILSDDNKKIEIRLRPDGTFYTQKDTTRMEGVPSFAARKGGSVRYDYTPSQTMFTGATSGNIVLGGFHQTKASYSQNNVTSDKGYIEGRIQENVIKVSEITMSQYVQRRFHRDSAFQRIAPKGYISCVRFSDTANMLARSAVSNSGDFYSMTSLLSRAADEKRIPFSDCVEIVNLLHRVVHGEFPPTDEEIYARAAELAKRNTSAELNRAIEEYQIISDYKDSAQQIRLLQDLYEEVLQREKEQAILDKEAAEKNRKYQWKKTKTRVLVCTVVLILMVAALTLFTEVVLPQKNYEEAEALLASGQYQEALAAFEEMGDFKDSAAKIVECEESIRAADYATAEELLASGELFQAATALYRLGDYQDAWERSTSIWGQITQRETISAGFQKTMGLKEDGTVVVVGDIFYYHNRDLSNWTDIVAISAEDGYVLGLKADGTVAVEGYNEEDYGNSNVRSWRDIVAISTGYNCTAGLKADGTVVEVGSQTFRIKDWHDIVAISAGASHIVGLHSDGTVVVDGENHEVYDWSDIVAISAGAYHTVGIKADGTVVAVGNNEEGQCEVSEWTEIVSISAGDDHTVGLKADGTVVSTKCSNYYSCCGKCEVSEWTDIIAISAGGYHTVGLKADGTMVSTNCTGQYVCEGQCKVSDWKDIKLP